MENYSNYYYYMQSLNNYQNYQAQLLQQQIETQSSSQPTSSQQSAESSTPGNNKVKQKSKRERWSHDQTKVRIIIIIYVDKFDELESSRCNQIWPSIVEAVSSHGPEKTLKQCKVRIRNMKNAYKKCKDENKKSRNKSNKSPFYDDSFNETQDLLGNSDSDFEVAVKRNKNSKKRKHDDSSDNDENIMKI